MVHYGFHTIIIHCLVAEMLICLHSWERVNIYVFVCVCFREKYTLEQDIVETEETIRHKSAKVQVRTAV